MAVKTTVFYKNIPLFVTGGFLLAQPFALLPMALASESQFNCRASASGWDCSTDVRPASLPPRPTTEVDPNAVALAADRGKSKAKPKDSVTENKGRVLTSRSEDYSHLDWVPRDQLTPAQLAEIGAYCAGSYIEPDRVGMDDKTPLGEAPTFVSANTSSYNADKQIGTVAGEVILQQGSVQVQADQAHLYRLQNTGDLEGNVRLRDKGGLIVGDSAEVDLANGTAQVNNAEFVAHETHYRGNARYIKRGSDGLIRLKDGTFTRCEPNDNMWTIRGNNVTLNRETGRGTATNATLRVKNIPILYTPFISFPIDKRRQTGFLMPSFSSSSDNGFTLSTPYYFNLAPNYDFTLYPTLMTKRGLLMEGQFRYLTENSSGQLAAAYLNDNNNDSSDRRMYDQDRRNRWMYSWQNTTGANSRWLAEVDYTRISDPFYFEDLDVSSAGVNSQVYVNQKGKLTYRGDSFTAGFNLHAYQMASVSNITAYDRLPQLTLMGTLPSTPSWFDFSYNAEFVRFERDLKDSTYSNYRTITNLDDYYMIESPDALIQGLLRANGNRTYVAPKISLPMEASWGYITPSLEYMYTHYDLDIDSRGKQQMAFAGDRFKSNVTRTAPAYRLDAGLYFDRKANWFGTNFTQTLEPRAMYLYVPYRKQDDIPIFDTSEDPFSYDRLFATNRFTGRDRIGDTNQVSVGLTSRLIEDNGFERQRVSLGQAYYFADRKVQMPGIDWRERRGATDDSSPIALQYLYRINNDWRITADYNWRAEQSKTESGSIMLHYQPESNLNKIFNIGFRYRDDNVVYNWWASKWQQSGDLTRRYYENGQWNTDTVKDYYKTKQLDTSFMWPIIPRWSLIGRWQYDYNRNRTLDSFGGFEYDSCCWQFRVVGRYWQKYDESIFSSTGSGSDRGIFFQVVFKGLGNVYGSSVNGFLDKGIEGYRKREDQSF